MTPKQVISYFGNQSKAARHIGISRAAISQWVQANKVPRARQYEIAARWPELKVSRGLK
jgi:DNA-binding transcriptional regulator YdaS (Cro superfamily)